jgi:hypothetical protein
MKGAIFYISWVDGKCFCSIQLVIFFYGSTAISAPGPLIIEASRSHSDTPHSVGLLSTSDQPDVGTLPVNTQKSQETGIKAPGGIRTRNPTKSERPQTTPRANTGVGHLVSYSVIKKFLYYELIITHTHSTTKKLKNVCPCEGCEGI